MSEEKKTEEQQGEQAEEQQCGCGQQSGEQAEQCSCGGHHSHHGYGGYGPHGGYGRRMAHVMRRRMWMRFATMTKDEEVEFLEDVKARLEERLKIVDERLVKLKA